jgi:hypothetical protein
MLFGCICNSFNSGFVAFCLFKYIILVCVSNDKMELQFQDRKNPLKKKLSTSTLIVIYFFFFKTISVDSMSTLIVIFYIFLIISASTKSRC